MGFIEACEGNRKGKDCNILECSLGTSYSVIVESCQGKLQDADSKHALSGKKSREMVSFLSVFSVYYCSMVRDLTSSAQIMTSVLLHVERLLSFKSSVV